MDTETNLGYLSTYSSAEEESSAQNTANLDLTLQPTHFTQKHGQKKLSDDG
jgi:hypothetical protein